MSSAVREKSNTGPQSKLSSSLQRTTSASGWNVGSSRLRTEATREAMSTSRGLRRVRCVGAVRVTSSTQTRSPGLARSAAPERGTFSETPASTCVTGPSGPPSTTGGKIAGSAAEAATRSGM